MSSTVHTDHEREQRSAEEVEEEEQVSRVHSLLHDRRKLATAILIIVLGVVAIYVLLPQVVGLDGTLERIGDATWYWVVIAVAATVLGFGAYVMLFQGVVAGGREVEGFRRLDLKASYQINMAGLAATRIFSAGGAGGIALTYWALRKAGMERRRSACRMVAFLALMYSVYLVALVVFGILLRSGVLPGEAPAGGTIVPAAVAGAVIFVLALVALIPEDVERRIRRLSDHPRAARLGAMLATGPATVATGVRTAIAYARHPRQGSLAILGAIGFWAAQITTLWASFEAFGGDVPLAVLVQGFFVGMAANLIPSPAGGVGSVDAGMIAAFALFGIPGEIVFPAVLTYRVIAFWLPIPPGIVAYFQLRRTVHEWENEGYTSQSKVTAEAT
ncbi:MAG: flippase-like domain-containing protein [Actinomycetota bacterium]|nr:flippase-like domain-containing protein [Actinomycetota bacterium]